MLTRKEFLIRSIYGCLFAATTGNAIASAVLSTNNKNENDDSFLDVIAIENLMQYYCYIHDYGVADQMGELFHTNAILQPVYQGTEVYYGKTAVRDWYAAQYAVEGQIKTYSIRKISCPMIDVQGNKGTALSYMDANGLHKGKLNHYVCGYEDDLIKEKGIWYFSRRKISIQYSYQKPYQGDIFFY